MGEADRELAERVARLEAEVARLGDLLKPRGLQPPPRPPYPPPVPPRPVPPRPAPPRPAPRMAKVNPVVLVAAVGAAIFLAGAAFFLHLAIQQGWVGPEMRFLMGLLAGGALAVLGGRQFFREGPALGACLLGAGLGTLLFTLYTGAFNYHFFPAGLGLAAAAMATLVAGGLAARARSGAALGVALLAGLAAPVLFSEGGHHEVGLAGYLAVLMAATTAVPYLARTGARWVPVRWLAVAGVWAMLGAASFHLMAADAGLFMGLLALHYLLAALWIWLPGQAEPRPANTTLLWVSATLAMTGLLWASWLSLGLMREAFAAPAAGIALVNLMLVKPLRARLGGRQADLGLLALAGVHLALLVPVALAWRWVGPVWGLYAAGLAWATGYAADHPEWEAEEVRSLALLAWGMTLLASLRWAFHLDLGSAAEVPFLNLGCAEGVLAAAGWAMLARRPGRAGRMVLLGLELVGNLVLAVELGRVARFTGAGPRAETITRTLVLAASGALQWVLSLRAAAPDLARPLALAGYGWLAAASVKLILFDLERAGTPLRALALLGVGGIFLAAALVGNRHRQSGRSAP